MSPMPNPISYEATDRYAVRHGFVGAGYERFCTLLAAMDDVYIQHAVDEAKRRKPGKH